MKSYSLGRVFDCIGRFRVDLFLLRFRCSARIRYHQLHHSHDEQVAQALWLQSWIQLYHFFCRQKAEEEKRKEALDKLIKTVQEKLKSVSPPKEDHTEEVEPEVNTVDKVEVVDVDDQVQQPVEKSGWSDTLKAHVDTWLKRIEPYRVQLADRLRFKPVKDTYVYSHTDDVLNSIDEYARKCFPATFLLLNFIYWTTYLYLFEDNLYED